MTNHITSTPTRRARAGRRRSLRILVSAALTATLLGGCSNNQESIERAAAYQQWLGQRPQIASVEKSTKRNSGVPPLLGTVRLEASATAKDPFGETEITALGDAIESYGKEHGHFTSYRTTVTGGPLTIDLLERPADNDAALRAFRQATAAADGKATKITIGWTRQQSDHSMEMRFTSTDDVLAAYRRLEPHLGGGTGSSTSRSPVVLMVDPEPEDPTASTPESRAALSALRIETGPGRQVSAAVLAAYEKAEPSLTHARISGGPEGRLELTAASRTDALAARQAVLGSGDPGISALTISADNLTIDGTGAIDAAQRVLDDTSDLGVTRAKITSAPEQGIALTLPDAQAAADATEADLSGLDTLSLTVTGAPGLYVAGTPDQVRATTPLAVAVSGQGFRAATTEEVTGDQPVLRIEMGRNPSEASYGEVMAELRDTGWEGERTFAFTTIGQGPKFRFTSTATGRASNVGPAEPRGGEQPTMSDQTKRIIATWDSSAG